MAENTIKQIQVAEKNAGKHIAYTVVDNKKITFGDDELTINLAARERDNAVTLDICIDDESGIVIGVGARARKYAAQIEIPARRYTEAEVGTDELTGEPRIIRVPEPFDLSLCTLILWKIEG